MKNLDLNALGVVEMDAVEMKENNGGFVCGGICLLIAGALLGAALTQDLDDLKAAYQKGYEAGNK